MEKMAKFVLAACVVLGGACAPDSRVQNAVQDTPSMKPARTAFMGLVMTTHYQLTDDESQVDVFPLRFSLDDSLPRNPFAMCAGRTLNVSTGSADASIWGKSASRPAATLREAYAACRTGGDLGVLEPLEHGFGVDASLQFQDALLDSFTVLAHAISKQSLLRALYRDLSLGTVLPPEATILELGRFGNRGLRDGLMRAVQSDAAAPRDQVAEACAALDVDALLFVSIEYAQRVSGHVSFDRAADPRTLRVDVLVLTPDNESPAARLRFEHSDSSQVAALRSVGAALVGALNPQSSEEESHPWSK